MHPLRRDQDGGAPSIAWVLGGVGPALDRKGRAGSPSGLGISAYCASCGIASRIIMIAFCSLVAILRESMWVPLSIGIIAILVVIQRLRRRRKGICSECELLKFLSSNKSIFGPDVLFKQTTKETFLRTETDPKTGVTYSVYETDGGITNQVSRIVCRKCGKVLWNREWN